ncbi:hypothetical protein BU197_08485 [Streptomyces sp. CBMA291]|nr:hypothetical protein [Streptomyces sp. CBMA291]MBD0717857.1 hypothetical protein [Streptomyces sp. CBMA370]
MVGRGARVTGGLRRHGGNRPLPLHKVMDSGNKGYACPAERCRPGAPTSRMSHLTRCFGVANGGKQAWFPRFPGTENRRHVRLRTYPCSPARRTCSSGSNPTSIRWRKASWKSDSDPAAP